MHHRVLSVVTTAFALSLVFACTVTTESPSGGSTSSSSSSSSGGTDGGKSNDGGSDEPSAAECKAKPSVEACEDCCGYTEKIDEIFGEAYFTCACEEACTTECADFCSGSAEEPSDTCIACLDGEKAFDTCQPKADEACEKDSKCRAFLECAEEACSDKLDGDGGDD